MERQCGLCHSAFVVSNEDLEFLRSISPKVAGQVVELPAPTWCPRCREVRRLSWRNERRLYRSKCELTGKPIVCSFPPDAGVQCAERSEWLNFDNRQFGRDYDFSRPFFEQFKDLYYSSVKANVIQGGEMINSEYTEFTGWLKNCYLLFNSGKNEDCSYGVALAYVKSCLECYWLLNCELCYEVIKADNCYDVKFSSYCSNCNTSAFLYDCIGCSDCLGCVNLRNKQYCVFNEQLSKAEYEKQRDYYLDGGRTRLIEIQEKFAQLLLSTPIRAVFNINALNCSGNYLINCENVHQGFEVAEARNCRYCSDLCYETQYCGDITTFGESMEYCYELSASGGARGKSLVSNCYFSLYNFYGGFNIFYSSNCQEHSKELFGCCDLRKGEYCILNKQYTKEDYEALVPKIIEHMRSTGEWGEFFPMTDSPYAYNESIAQEYYPSTEEAITKIGLRWSHYEPPKPKVDKFIPADQIPDNIRDVTDDLLSYAVICEATGRPFKIIPSELNYYRQNNLPLPRKHPEERQRIRSLKIHKRQLVQRTCSNCQCQTQSVFDESNPQIIVCPECYQKQVYG